jgi:hypothetical protein
MLENRRFLKFSRDNYFPSQNSVLLGINILKILTFLQVIICVKRKKKNLGPLFSFAGGWGVEFFLFPMCSHKVLTVFLSSFQCVLNMFPIAPHFIPYPLP